jgi:hypothetical protein
MMSNTSISSKQTVGTNLGSMVAMDIGTVHGNLTVEKISQILIMTFSPEGRQKPEIIPVDASPYLSLYPFTASTAPLFRGRDKDIQSVIDMLGTQQVLVIHGHTGVGKTSLLAAGVFPKLAHAGVFPIQIQDYKDPVRLIVESLSEEGSKFAFEIPKEDKLAIFLGQLQKAVRGTIVLILDQFELLFEGSITEEQRDSFIDDLADAISRIDKDLFRVVISVRGYAFERLGSLETKIKNVLLCSFQLQPLNHDQARSAIEDPDRVFFESDLPGPTDDPTPPVPEGSPDPNASPKPVERSDLIAAWATKLNNDAWFFRNKRHPLPLPPDEAQLEKWDRIGTDEDGQAKLRFECGTIFLFHDTHLTPSPCLRSSTWSGNCLRGGAISLEVKRRTCGRKLLLATNSAEISLGNLYSAHSFMRTSQHTPFSEGSSFYFPMNSIVQDQSGTTLIAYYFPRQKATLLQVRTLKHGVVAVTPVTSEGNRKQARQPPDRIELNESQCAVLQPGLTPGPDIRGC